MLSFCVRAPAGPPTVPPASKRGSSTTPPTSGTSAGAPFGDLDAGGTGSQRAEDRILALGALRAANRTVAERYLDADPAVRAGRFVYELRPWTVSLPAAGD